MEYKFLKYLNESELNQLETILLEESLREELLNQVQRIRNKISTQNGYNFSSSYIPNYDKELDEKLIEILKQLNINDIPSFFVSFKNPGNTKSRHQGFTEKVYSKMENKIDKETYLKLNDLISHAYSYYLYGHKPKTGIVSLEEVNTLFENQYIQETFEGPYNMYNYIKNYLYYLLKHEIEVTEKEVFSDIEDKRKIITIQFKDISSYLYEIRNGTNLRLCISNAGLSKGINKIGDRFTDDQQVFIDALAFGTTLEKLEDRNYEDYKKLLYLPQGKELIK